MTHFLGIDPGLEGACVLINEDSEILLHKKMPIIKIKNGNKIKTHYDTINLVSFFKVLKSSYSDIHTCVEEVGAAPGQGVVSMFTFGQGFGLIVGILSAFELPYTLVRPNIWKQDLLLGLPKEKNASLVAAARLFPQALHKIKELTGHFDHNIADALLIAEWGRRRG